MKHNFWVRNSYMIYVQYIKAQDSIYDKAQFMKLQLSIN